MFTSADKQLNRKIMSMQISISKMLALTLVFIPIIVRAQQDPMYTQYMFNTLAVNPGYAGSRGALNITGLNRAQWVGIDGAPVTQTFFAHTPLFSKKIGVGLSVINDKIGPIRQTMIFGDYSYTIKITENSKLAMGLKFGLNMYKTTFNDVSVNQSNDDAFTDLPIKPQPNFGFGLYYYSDQYYFGISTPKLLQPKMEQQLDYSKIMVKRHFFIIGGYVWSINEQLKFKPTTLIKMTSGAPVSLDLNANMLFRDKLWVGVGYRFGDSFNATMELQLTNQLKVGYSYDYTISQLTKYNHGSHEFMISYDFVFKKDKIISPRYF
jgi:type IX secretion system PorP/SprF family membrane protein